jgi:hypothetical protein
MALLFSALTCFGTRCTLLGSFLGSLGLALIGCKSKPIIISHREIRSTSVAIFMRSRLRSTSSSGVPSVMIIEDDFIVFLGSLKILSSPCSFRIRDPWPYMREVLRLRSHSLWRPLPSLYTSKPITSFFSTLLTNRGTKR